MGQLYDAIYQISKLSDKKLTKVFIPRIYYSSFDIVMQWYGTI